MLASELYGSPVPPYMDIYLRVVETGESTQFESWYAPMGKHFIISVISPLEGQFFTIFMDITDRKNLESELKKKADDLSRSNADLQQFAYVASHDLQEPLRMITAYLDLLRTRHGDKLPEEAQQYLETAYNGSRRMKALINDLLTYARLDSQEQVTGPVDLNLTVQRVLHTMRSTIEERGAIIECSPLPTVMADQSQMSLNCCRTSSPSDQVPW
jgi:signal transduction histidine kinase